MKGIDLSQLRWPTAPSRIRIKAGLLRLALIASVLTLLSGCNDSDVKATPVSPAAKTLEFYAFAEDMPQAVLDAFTKEHGVAVHYNAFQSPEEAEERIRAGDHYDVVLVENQLFPGLIKEHLLAEINLANIPNFKSISANFRDFAIDPGNRYSVPASYGTTGLVVRTDLVGSGLTRWADLWDRQYAGKIGLRAQPREIIGMTLTSLGYPLASESPRELELALQHLLALKPSVVMLNIEADDAVEKLLLGEIAVLHGYAEDYLDARNDNPAVTYVLPMEGTALWGESYAIAVAGRHRRNAERFINFLLRPEVTAQIINDKKYAQPNDAALPLVKSELCNNPVVFPDDQTLRNGSIILPLSPEGKKLYADIWSRFMAESP